MTPAELQFVLKAEEQASASGHIFPKMAACEAAEESKYGQSLLAIQDNNLFGLKLHAHNEYGRCVLPTREFENSEWVEVAGASFEKYDNWQDCFSDRMATLCRLAAVYPHYAAALHASDDQTYVAEVSKTWSTDLRRAETIEAIYWEVYGAVTA
jgi:flagellum-specific peptidoglycan hydrolase FlgJ